MFNYLKPLNLYLIQVGKLKLKIQSIINFLHKTNAKLKGYKQLQYLKFLNKLRQIPRYKKLIIPNKYGNDLN